MADKTLHTRPPGWKKDPFGRFFGRYWDGERWTEHVVNADKTTTVDALGPEPSADWPSVPTPDTPGPVTAPAPAPKKRRARRRVWVGLAVLVVGIAAAAGWAQRSHTPRPSSATTAGGNPAPPPVKGDLMIGQTAKTGDFEVMVYGFRTPAQSTNPADQAKAGNHFVGVDVQVANKGPSQQAFSPRQALHVVDRANRQYDQVTTSITPALPDGQVKPGEAVRGTVVFEVPDGTTGLRLRVQGSGAPDAFFTLA